MSRIGIDLSDCCNYLESSKKTERRKRIDELKLLLDNKISIEFLNRNSETKTGISWLSVFTSLHQCLRQEADSYCKEITTDKKKVLPATDKAVKACCGLLVLVVNKANAGQPLLPCHDLFSCILEVCEIAESNEVILKSIVGETYISLLCLALSSEKYWGEINFQTWKGLRTLCLNLIQNASSERVKASIMSVFNIILLHGGKLSPLIIKSKKLLSVFPDILKNLSHQRNTNVDINSLHVCHTICTQFGKEFKLSVCGFIDQILPFIMSLNDNRMSDVHFKELSAQVLLEMVAIRMTDKNWNQEAMSLLNFAERELADISKHKLPYPQLPKIVVLAVKLVKQLHLEKGGSEEFEDPVIKRRKMTSFVGVILDNITTFQQCPWPWLCYLDHLLEKAPEVLGDDDVSLFHYLTEALTSTNEPLSLQYLTRSSARLLNLCKTKNVITNDKYYQDLQSALWSTVFRCISSQSTTEIGLLLAIDLIPDWSSQESMKILLELFLERKIPVSTTSQKTLLYLSSTGYIKSSRDRISLVQWCLSGDDYSADTVIRLLVKTKLPAPEKIFQTDLCETDTEHFLTITSLGYVHCSPKSLPIEVENRAVQEDREVCEALLRYLVDRLSEVNSTGALLKFSSSLCALQGLSLKYNLSVSSKIQELLDKTLSGLFPRLEDEFKTKEIDDNMHSFLISTSNFFNNLSKINKTTNSEVLQSLASIMMDRLKQHYERMLAFGVNEKQATVLNIEITSNSKESTKELIEVTMIETILNIAESLSDEEKLYLFVKILNFCSNKLNLSYKLGFRIVCDFTRYIVSSKVVTQILIKDIMKLELKLLKRWYMCYNETMMILDLLIDTVEPVFLLDESNEVTPEIYRILSIFAKYISSKKYGPQILSKYVTLLAHVIKVDLHGKESVETGDGIQNPLLYFIEFLNNPFHEVRMKAADCLPLLFDSKISLRKKQEHEIAFTNALKAVDNLFIVKDGKTPDEVREEGLNRSCCALKVLLGLTCSSFIWRRKALFHLFKIISSKKISQTLFSKVHHYIEKSLNLENVLPFLEHNLDYILWSWYNDYKDFQNFPYLFMNYESLQAFLKEYKAIVVTIFLENNDVNGFKSLCDVLDSTGLDIAKSCFPDMIACLLPKLGGSDLKRANEIHEFILDLIDQNTLKKLLSSEIRKVLLAVYMKLNDLDHFQNLCGSSMSQLPSPTPLCISIEGIQATLQYMQRTSPNPEQCLLVLLCNEYPNYIQFIMQYLVANISLASTTENRSLCFLQYISFCETLASELSNIKKMAGFVIWHATHALLNLLPSDLAVPASSFLLRFLENCFLNHAKFVDYLLDSLYPTILSLCDVDSESGQIASRIKDLLVEKKSMLSRFIAYLPLEETTANLEEELNIFIKRKSPDVPALERLSIQLGMRKKELKALYERVKSTRCFSEDCSRSVIHKLISKLVTLATSPDTKIQNAAAKCLGQIGPKNLNTLALQPESNSAPPPLAEKILSLLLPLIVHNDSEICDAASAAITELLLTREGYASLDKLNDIEKTFLIPFYPPNPEIADSIQKTFNSVHLNWASCIRVLGSGSEGWALWSGKSHSDWIRSVSSRLFAAFDGGVLPLLSPLAAKETEIGEELLPYIIEIILELAEEEPEGLKIVQSNLEYFFKKHFALRNSSEKVEDDTLIYVNRKSVRCMLSIVNFYRFKSAGLPESERLESLKLLKVNLLHVAYAAQFCRAYFTSLIYAELWVESVKSEFLSSTYSSNKIPLDEVCKKFPEDGRILLNLLWEDYKELGEQDSIEGCVRLQLGESSARIRYFREMGLWQQLIAEAEVGEDQEALTQGLLMSGLFTVASHLNHGGWDAAWRLSQWETETQPSGNDDFSSLHYSALKAALYLKDRENTLTLLDSARSVVLRDLAHASLEVASSVYIPLAKLQLINEVENWCEHDEVEKELPDSDWVHLEPILWQRGLLSRDPQHWLSSAKIARANKSHLIAQRFLQNVKKMEINKKIFDEVKVEEAKSHWDCGNLQIAIYILRTLLDRIDDPVLKAQCFLTYGTWMSETKSEGPKAIIEQYFEQATLLVDSKNNERLGAAKCLAKFADSEYQRIHRYLLSPEFDMKKAQVDSFRRHLQVIESTPSQQKTLDERKSAKIHSVNLEVDEAEIKAVQKEYLSFLRLAVREYLYSLQFDETTSDKMFRFVSLWLANKNSSLKKDLDTWLSWVPSYRFIPVFPQLAVRISPDEEPFSRTLRKLLYRCAKEHPHHCLWHLLALSNADVDKNSDSDSPPQPRVIGATNILNDLEKSKTVGTIVIAMKELAMAYINLANATPSNPKQIEHKISKHEKLRIFRDIIYITCATMNSPIKKNADYSNIIGIVRFDDTYTLVGGINCPKKVKCLCTDGKKRIELVKGNDDPRQDALMQQVFSVLNTLLEGEQETSRRKLSVRTYKVVPLTQKSGVIEWCENTETIGGYLMHAHSRHRPQDISLAECRNRLQAVASRGPDEKLKAFLKICSELKPVMRHFFFERFPTPGEWYEKRLAYTRSIATNSMIGYMMGIGDRHVNNILIDKETAELIHIDFGIAFELARILPTPETVPFRLTRDIEDGMGITGVEGVFRRCCEETMKVLRKSSEPILTTLEMLLYDPLYSWSVKPKSTPSQQTIPDMSTEETNKLAERFLQRLKLKLGGREEGEASSVEGQVRILIQEAKDPKNLSRLFRGWQAFL